MLIEGPPGPRGPAVSRLITVSFIAFDLSTVLFYSQVDTILVLL